MTCVAREGIYDELQGADPVGRGQLTRENSRPRADLFLSCAEEVESASIAVPSRLVAAWPGTDTSWSLGFAVNSVLSGPGAGQELGEAPVTWLEQAAGGLGRAARLQ